MFHCYANKKVRRVKNKPAALKAYRLKFGYSMLKESQLSSSSLKPLTSLEFKLVDMRGNEQSGGKGLLLYGNGTVCGGESFDSTTADAICTDMG